MWLAGVRSMKRCYLRRQGADQQLQARRLRRHAIPQRVVSSGGPREVLTAESLLSTFGAVSRQGEGGVPFVDHDHDHGGDANQGMP